MADLYIVGIGPGAYKSMTMEAADALSKCPVIVGYTVYADLIREHFPDKEYITTAMRQEEVRCRMALDRAAEGIDTAVVCSGDSGVYGMAGIMCEVAADHPEVEIEVVPGITAACSGASVLGAPLIHDFAVISLSDLLTPWEKIEKRLELAGEADFVICLYNPKSKKRRSHLDRAVEIIGRTRSMDTVCGYVRNIGREGETGVVCSLKDLAENDDIDMFTTVFIGNSQTKVINGRMVTPRGYKDVL